MQRKSNKKVLLIPAVYLAAILLSGCSEIGTAPVGKNFKKDVDILSSAEFEGRAPASPGGTKSKNYITKRFMEAGLKPGYNGSYLQAVPLLETESSDFSPVIVAGNQFSLSFSSPEDIVIGSFRMEDKIDINNSEMVFAGYGIVAPEYNWNDYKGIDVTGKTVIVLVNDPGFVTGDSSFFNGRTMTYYGRWSYKFEEAARQGAAAALVIHQTEPAGYGWEVVSNSWSGTQYSVVMDDNKNRLHAEGWIQYDAAKDIFHKSGIDFADAITEAARPGFSAIQLEAAVSASFRNSYRHSECHNVLGYIEGSSYPEETIVYMAHWDHLGMVKDTDGSAKIYHGAVDNATGVAALVAIAEAFNADEKAPERSVLFIAVTAEESGLLGSQYYAEHPSFAIANTVGGINIDAMNVYGPTHDVTSIGYGFSEFDNLLEKHASAQQRTVKPDPNPERGYYYRSDHFNLARLGIPMIYAKGGKDYIGKDKAYSKMAEDDYARRYHTPSDVVNELWDFEGIKQDLLLFYNIGKDLANSDTFPNWVEGNEFKAIRDSTAHQRKR